MIDPLLDEQIQLLEARAALKDAPAGNSNLPAWLPLVMVAPFIVGVITVGMLVNWRIAHFPHAVATITAVWDEEGSYEGHYKRETVGKITFTRSHDGKSFNCEITTGLGQPEDHFAVGQKLDVVPATGTCERVNVAGRILQ